jgi:hypothetical protein
MEINNGNILQHKLTGDKVMVMSKILGGLNNEAKAYIVRLHNYAEIRVERFELEEVKE